MISDLELLIQRFSYASVSLGDIEMLTHFAKNLDFIVELGTNIGTTSILLSAIAKKVCTVDVFEMVDLIEDTEQRDIYTKTFNNNKHYYESIEKKLSSFNIKVHQNLSYRFADLFRPQSVDMVFIDADHSYEGVKKDFEAWYDKIKIGGYYAFHDCIEAFPVFTYKTNTLDHDKRIINVSDMVTIDSPSRTSIVVFQRVQ